MLMRQKMETKVCLPQQNRVFTCHCSRDIVFSQCHAQLFPKVYGNFVVRFQETMAQQMVHASIYLDSSLHLVFLSLILCFVKPREGFNPPDRQHNYLLRVQILSASLNQKYEPHLFENLPSLGGVLIKFFSDSWKHGNLKGVGGGYSGFQVTGMIKGFWGG